jgi:hypothetical protein
VNTIEELLARNSSGSGLENQEYGCREGSVMLTTWHPVSAKVDTNLVDKRRSLGRFNSHVDSSLGVLDLRFKILDLSGGGSADIVRSWTKATEFV